MSVPVLRFKNADGAEFPEWSTVQLKNIAERVKTKNKEDNKNVLTISAQQGLINQEKYFNKSVAAKDLTNYYLIHKGDFAYNKSYSNGYPMGAIKCLKNYEKGVVSTLYICFKFQAVYVNNFFEQYFETGLHNKEIEKVAQEGARNHGLLNIGLDDFFNISLTIPSAAEQTKIADFLSAVDEKISQFTQKHELLNQYKKGVMQKIFSQELRFKDDDGNQFPQWLEVRLGEIANIVGGGTPDTSVEDYWKGHINWFTPAELKEKYVIKSRRSITQLGLQNSAAKILPVGTLLLSSRATVGDVSIASCECSTNQGFQSLIVNSSDNNEFIYYWLLNNKKTLLEKASGSTFLEISKKEIEKILIKKPSRKEQTKIANFLTAIDDKITATKSKLELVKQYKQGLLQQMFVQS